MDFVLCTVPHTGTTFVEKFFFNRGWHDGLPQDRSDGRTVHRNHCTEDQYVNQALQKVRDQVLPLVTTIRHPFLVEESWRRRGKEIGPMIDAFDLWLERIFPAASLVFSVDSPRRQALMECGADFFNVSRETDWHPERVVGKTYDMTHNDCHPSLAVQSLACRMGDILREFYDSP